jgi:hypothetical protein
VSLLIYTNKYAYFAWNILLFLEKYINFEYLTNEQLKSIKIAVLWNVAPCSLVAVYRRFRGARWLSYQGDIRLHGATIQNTAIFILAAVRTSNSTRLKSGRYEMKVWLEFHYTNSFLKCSLHFFSCCRWCYINSWGRRSDEETHSEFVGKFRIVV